MMSLFEIQLEQLHPTGNEIGSILKNPRADYIRKELLLVSFI